MKPRMKVTGVDGVIMTFRHKARTVPDRARKVMHRNTDKIVEEAKLNTPEDDRELVDAIHKEKSYEGRGRLKIVVTVGGTVRGVNVDRYAALIHENYESMKPGPNTIAKRIANPGRYIGSKFLERAAQKYDEKFIAADIEREIELELE